ncbi:MAG: class I SAM-dependent methyltransferase [Candidatus Omnitrophica bacterium]|nr:class I SAM-dependent methyltransferase [Candidatus Omnitrophota bacterium]MBU1996590.1 class I SAM-dependent methyltransferase [Candidatus Omnitrophota bacterium]MBU4334226.1 class I SAM-dependent methyltransferase [Candidatus Omnitrophota bacterium]
MNNKKEIKKKKKALKFINENKGKIILDLGCRHQKVPGAIGVDMDPDADVDVIHDFDNFPYPFEDNYADKIFATHIIEHLEQPGEFLKEIYRILKPGGQVFIATPHFTSYTAYCEHTHKAYYSYFMFRNLLAETGSKFQVKKCEVTFYKSFRRAGISYLANKFPENYERFWAYIFPAENIEILLEKPF